VLANMVLAAVSEAILLVPGADDPAAAVERGLRALNVFLDRLVGA
jgi:hypothetical protein